MWPKEMLMQVNELLRQIADTIVVAKSTIWNIL